MENQKIVIQEGLRGENGIVGVTDECCQLETVSTGPCPWHEAGGFACTKHLSSLEQILPSKLRCQANLDPKEVESIQYVVNHYQIAVDARSTDKPLPSEWERIVDDFGRQGFKQLTQVKGAMTGVRDVSLCKERVALTRGPIGDEVGVSLCLLGR